MIRFVRGLEPEVRHVFADNLTYLRKVTGKSQEEVAEALGVSRQTIAKWESGESQPTIEKCAAIAQLVDVTLDDLVSYTAEQQEVPMPIGPKGKHFFGAVPVSERGQIVIPAKAREIFGIKPGDRLVLLGDEERGLALLQEEQVMEMLREADV